VAEGHEQEGIPSVRYGRGRRRGPPLGELLGALSVTMPPSDPMNPSKERLVRDLAAQAGLVLRNVRLIDELRASRRRIVTAQTSAPSISNATCTMVRSSSSLHSGCSWASPVGSPHASRPRWPRRSKGCERRRPTRSKTCETWRAGSTRRYSRTRAWSSRSRRKRARLRSPSRSKAAGSAATRRRWRRPSTSAASRRSRTSRSTRTRRARACDSPTRTARSRSR
jgi:hypothetical protein